MSNTIPKMKVLENTLTIELTHELENFLELWQSKQEFIELQTSGSTGEKKLITAKKRYLKASAHATLKFFNLSDQSTILHCLPLGFVAGKMMLIRLLESNAHAIFTAPSAPLAFANDADIHFAAMTPYQYAKCIETNPEKLMQIKTVLLGGGPVSHGIEEQIKQNQQSVYHSYGMTETYSHVALRKIGVSDHFTALEGVNFEISSENTLIISAPHLGIQKLETNDVIEMIDSKNFRFLGRKDFVINSGGIKLHPEELEQKIAPVFTDLRYFFSSKPDQYLGEVLILLIESPIEFTLPDLSTILNKYERPRQVILCKQFVYTPSGKIDRINTLKNYLL